MKISYEDEVVRTGTKEFEDLKEADRWCLHGEEASASEMRNSVPPGGFPKNPATKAKTIWTLQWGAARALRHNPYHEEALRVTSAPANAIAESRYDTDPLVLKYAMRVAKRLTKVMLSVPDEYKATALAYFQQKWRDNPRNPRNQ